MDVNDYVALDTHIRANTGQAQAARTPLAAVHSTPMHPGYSTVLVAYSATPTKPDGSYDHQAPQKAVVEVLGYCPAAEMNWGSDRDRGPQTFSPVDEDTTMEFEGDLAHVNAMEEFIRWLSENTAQERDLVTPAEPVESADRFGPPSGTAQHS